MFKKNSQKKAKGFYSLTVKYYLGFSIAMVVITLLGIIFVVQSINYALVYDDYRELAKYKDCFVDGRYGDVDARDILGIDGYFNVIDSDGKLIYSSDKKKKHKYNKDHIKLIADYDVKTEVTESNNKIFITRYHTDFLKNESNFKTLVVLDLYGNVQYSTLKNMPRKLSNKQFIYLRAISTSGQGIKKIKFNRGDRTYYVIAYGRNTELPRAKRVVKPIILTMSVVLILYILIFTITIRSLKNKVIKPVNLVDNAIKNFSNDKFVEDIEYKGIREFENICHNFNYMAGTIKKSNDEKNKMLSNISHDIKTPIAVLLGYTEMLKNNMVPEKDGAYYLDAIYNKARLTAELIDTFHDYSKLNRTEKILKMEELDICEEMRKYLSEKYSELEINNIDLDINIVEPSINIMGDRLYLKRAFENIISNSIKHNDKGIKLLVVIEQRKNYVDIYIGDNGKGLDIETKEKIFRPFYMGDNSRNNEKSSGLGMAISKKIINLHGGEIMVMDPPHKGYKTEFKITLNRSLT